MKVKHSVDAIVTKLKRNVPNLMTLSDAERACEINAECVRDLTQTEDGFDLLALYRAVKNELEGGVK